LGERISHFFSSLFGNDEHRNDATHYTDAVRSGRSVVTVDARTDDEAERAADILDEHGVVDIQQGAQTQQRGQTQQTGWAGSSAPAGTASSRDINNAGLGEREQVIPVVQEELQVGKRRRERGGVRIYTHAEQEQVQENVRLRDEHARVERRPVDRPATQADLAAFKEGTIEVRETIEEPVVAKQARVVEEVVVGKEVTERTETVRDSVMNGQVEVERLNTSDATGSTQRASGTFDDQYDADYRKDWQTRYASSGGRYEDYQPAYQYGSTLASDERYRNRSWTEIEPDARRDWETRHPGSAWEKFKASAQHGWERVTGRR